MRACNSEDCLVATVSRPFLKPNVAFKLFEAIGSHDAAVPRWKDKTTEPLLAVYRKKPFLKAAPKARGGRMDSVIDDLYAVTFVEIEETLRPLDPDLLSFFKVKTDADFKKAKIIALAQEVR
jgi:molybdopterin-guanine dinucleotide biosynthesis protein A